METREIIFGVNENNEKINISILNIMIDIFSAPSRAFENLVIKPRWLLPFIICTLTMIFFTISTYDYKLEDIKQDLLSNQTLDEGEIQRRVANIEMQKGGNLSNMHIPSFLFGVGFITLGQAVSLFGLALIIWLALHLYQPKVSYKSILAVCSFSYLVLLPEAVLKIPLIFLKGTMKIYLGLAAFLPVKWETSPLFNLFEKIDLFSIWMIILLIIGITIVTRISKKKAVITIGYLYGIWLLFSMMVGDIFQIV